MALVSRPSRRQDVCSNVQSNNDFVDGRHDEVAFRAAILVAPVETSHVVVSVAGAAVVGIGSSSLLIRLLLVILARFRLCRMMQSC